MKWVSLDLGYKHGRVTQWERERESCVFSFFFFFSMLQKRQAENEVRRRFFHFLRDERAAGWALVLVFYLFCLFVHFLLWFINSMQRARELVSFEESFIARGNRRIFISFLNTQYFQNQIKRTPNERSDPI